MTDRAPKVFSSYSHDDDAHKGWVLALCDRLVRNGVDVVLDQWDLTLGRDLPRFMEQGLTQADRVLAVCTGTCVSKANAGNGGIGYEKMILTAQLMKDTSSDRIIPIVRRSDGFDPVPTFLSSRLYIDFRDDSQFEAHYAELLREIHGQKLKPRPALGPNPFLQEKIPPLSPVLSFNCDRYISPALSGQVTFDYSGDMAFETAWSGGSNTAVHAYNDPPSIRTVALAIGAREFTDIGEASLASLYDTSSRVRTPRLGEIVIWGNSAGYYAATRVDALKGRGHGSDTDEIKFTYVIQPLRSSVFPAR
jgi:hypothetical protein